MQSSFGAQSDFKTICYNNDELCVIHFTFGWFTICSLLTMDAFHCFFSFNYEHYGKNVCTDETHTRTSSHLIAHTHCTLPRCYGSSNERPSHIHPPINCSSLRNSYNHNCNPNVNTDHTANVKMCIISWVSERPRHQPLLERRLPCAY